MNTIEHKIPDITCYVFNFSDGPLRREMVFLVVLPAKVVVKYRDYFSTFYSKDFSEPILSNIVICTMKLTSPDQIRDIGVPNLVVHFQQAMSLATAPNCKASGWPLAVLKMVDYGSKISEASNCFGTDR